ncbi:hypothetical protein LTR08_004221 [Meristemomyces frigidus]|nr:hypothetical protein LTR08_004221 [Meristemomyces frigidus]
MFVPPPIQLTRAQIEQLKGEAEQRAREKAEKTKENRKSIESGGSGHSLTKIESAGSLQRTESHSPKRRTNIFSKSSKLKISNPTVHSPGSESSNSPLRRIQSSDDAGRPNRIPTGYSPVPFGEQPRRAPRPPKRPARPRSDFFLPPLPGDFPVQYTAPGEQPDRSPPPVPQRSPRKGSSSIRQPQALQSDWKQSSYSESSLKETASAVGAGNDATGKVDGGPTYLSQSPTIPIAAGRRDTKTVSRSSPDKAGTLLSDAENKIDDESLAKRADATTSTKITAVGTEDSPIKRPRRSTESNVKQVSTAPNEAGLPWQRRRKGETMDMLLDAGFFQGSKQRGQLTVQIKDDLRKTTLLSIPPPLSLIDKDLPDTPDSILQTPTELYHSAPKGPLPKTKRKVTTPKRSPLAQSSAAKSNSGDRGEEVSPSRLSSIPELSGTAEDSPLSSGVTTPVATQIQLRSGSVITVTPPELTAWLRHVYVQGPIKLPKPAIMPRKNSVATLDAFQGVIDQVYQDGMAIPRRPSDDAVVEDICEWYEDFGFDDVGFQGDVLGGAEINVDEVDEVQELEETDSQEIQRFSTPPLELMVTPIEKLVAKEVIEKEVSDMAKLPPNAKLPMPPVETEEALRARGISRLVQQTRKASLSQQARKESLTLAKIEAILPVTPAPEESMFPDVDTPSSSDDETYFPSRGMVDPGGMDWDDDVEELDEQPIWTARYKGRGFHRKKETRNPVTRVRRLMATASAIL